MRIPRFGLALLLLTLHMPQRPITVAVMNADMAHMPDYTGDPDGPTHVVRGAETMSGKQTYWNIVVQPGGVLTWDGTADISAVTIFVADGGEWDRAKGSRLTIRDVRMNTSFDPDQFGHGIICFGTCKFSGTPKLEYTRFGQEPHAGDRTIVLSEPAVGWHVGDEVAIPGTSGCPTDDLIDFTPPGIPDGVGPPKCRATTSETQRVAFVSPDGLRVDLVLPLVYEHPATRDYSGTIRLQPWVANLTRDIVTRSENANGVRGHAMFTERASVDIEYAEFDDMGRTCSEQLDATIWQGLNPTHIGTCQPGKYAMHYHHLIGPRSGPAPIIKGSVTNRSRKWGMSVHDTHYAKFQRNVLWDSEGAALVTETGQETENDISGNFFAFVRGSNFSHEADDIVGTFGTGGDCGWFSGGNNHINNNVAVDCRRSGFNFILGVNSHQSLRCSKFQGADPMLPDEGYDCQPDKLEVLEFNGNKCANAFKGCFFFYNLATVHPVDFHDLEATRTHLGFEVGNGNSITLRNLTILGDCSANTARTDGARFEQNHDLTIINPDVECVRLGISALQPGYADLTDPSWVTIRGTAATQPGKVYANIALAVTRDTHNQVVGFQSHGTVLVQDMLVRADPTGGSLPYLYFFTSPVIDGSDVTVRWTWTNKNVNGRNSRVYVPEQGPFAPMPTTGTWKDPATGVTYNGLKGIDTPGLTTAQSFAQYGIAYNGEVASCNEITPKVYGYLCPPGDDGAPSLLAATRANGSAKPHGKVRAPSHSRRVIEVRR